MEAEAEVAEAAAVAEEAVAVEAAEAEMTDQGSRLHQDLILRAP